MYSTCLYCTRDLGSNQVIETLPVGRRIAFDSRNGRLWVICPRCARWNLVPFESRLESIDEAERRFHDARTRYSTENIGLARLKEGLTLVRIGPALRPEFAAWRYGVRFASRRRRNFVVGTGLGLGTMAVVLGAKAAFGGGLFLYQVLTTAIPIAFSSRRIRVRHRLESGEQLTLTHRDIMESCLRLEEGDGWFLGLNARVGATGAWCDGVRPESFLSLRHGEAESLLGRILPIISGTAGSSKQVRDATELLEVHGSMGALLGTRNLGGNAVSVIGNPTLGSTPEVARLAVEMLANEQTERRVLEGELSLLERQWKEAEQLARISDDLALPEGIDAELERRRR